MRSEIKANRVHQKISELRDVLFMGSDFASAELRAQGAKRFVQLIQKVRLTTLALFGLMGLAIFTVGSFLTLTMSLLFFLTERTPGNTALFICSLVFFLLAVGAVWFLVSEKSWLKFSGAQDLVQNVQEEARESRYRGLFPEGQPTS